MPFTKKECHPPIVQLEDLLRSLLNVGVDETAFQLDEFPVEHVRVPVRLVLVSLASKQIGLVFDRPNLNLVDRDQNLITNGFQEIIAM